MTAFSFPVLSSLATSCIMRPSALTKPRWYLGPSPSVPSASLQVCKTLQAGGKQQVDVNLGVNVYSICY